VRIENKITVRPQTVIHQDVSLREGGVQFFRVLPFQGIGTPPPSIQDVFHQLWTDEKKNTLIVNDIVRAYNEGRECLVLSERLEHLSMLRERLNNPIAHLFMLTGGMGKKQYQAVMEHINNVPNGANRVILATGKYLGF
jgi:hypothetical protein